MVAGESPSMCMVTSPTSLPATAALASGVRKPLMSLMMLAPAAMTRAIVPG